MRLLALKCILLACLATTLTAEETRPKRDLQFLKEVIAAKLGLTPPKPTQKEENVHILRIPNFDQIVVKEVPKFTVVEVPTPEKIIRIDPTMDIIGSYLGTKTQEESFLVQQAVKQLIKMGVLIPNQEVVQLAPPKSSIYVLSSPVEQQRVEHREPRPLYPIFKETVVPLPSSVISQVPALRSFPIPYLQMVPVLPSPPQRVIPAPPKIVVPEIRPVPVPPPVSVPLPPPVISVPIVPTSYSYRQIHKDGSVTSYLSEANQEVIITETNIPPPPPPAFIIDRLQKIVYGKPLGSPVSTPTFSDVVVGPFHPEPLLPIITEPSSVDVKVKNSDKDGTGTNTNKVHVISTALPEHAVAQSPVAVDIRTAPLVIPSPPIVTESPMSEDDDNDRYKHVHADGSASTFTDTLSNGESYEIVNSEDISKLSPPPPELLHRIATAAGKAQYKPWGYSLKMSNGVGTYETLDGGKIYYSHLENPDKSDVFPDPLSSPNSDKPKNPNKNIFVVGYEDSELDEYGKPFLSTETNGENQNAVQPNFEPIKKTPPLPMPIAGENQKNTHPHSMGAAKYSYKIVNNPADYHGFGSDGFSYTQVNHDGTVETFTGTEILSRPFQEKDKMVHSVPAPVSKNPTPIEHPPSTVNVGEGLGFSYTQINNGGIITSITEDREVSVPAPVLVADKAPLRPVAVVDILQPVSKNPCKTNKKCNKPVSSGFSYTQIDGGRVTEIIRDGQVIKPAFSEASQVPVAPAAIVDVIQPYAKPEPVVVKVGAKSPGSVRFEKPPVSNYVYRQISHAFSKPFTVVKIENEPIIEVPVADVHVKVNPHKHVRPDGTTYLCTEFHKVAPDASIPPLPTDKVVATIPDNLLYVPPLDLNIPFPTSHKVENIDSGSHFSYTQLSSGRSTENSISTAEIPKEETTVEASSSDEPISFELNPIVVASEDMKYSYTQKNSDGSSLNIEGDKDNTVSVSLGNDDAKSTDSVIAEDSEAKTSDSTRGDIPAASS